MANVNEQHGGPNYLRLGIIVAVATILSVVTFISVRALAKQRPTEAVPAETAPLLVVSPEHLWFGEVWEESKFKWKVPVRNAADRTIVVEDMSGSCTCSAIEPKTFSLAPGETRELQLTLNLARRAGEPIAALRDFDLVLNAFIKSDEAHKLRDSWMLKGRVRSAYCVEPSGIDFGNCSIEGQPLTPREAIVECLLPLEELKIDDSGSTCDVTCRPETDRPNTYRISVAPNRKLPLGDFTFDVIMRPKAAQYPAYPDLKVSVTGRVVEDVQSTPDHVEFGSCTVAETANEYLTLGSLTGRPFTVEGWDVKGDGLIVEKHPQRSATFIVRQRAMAMGQQKNSVVFRVVGKAGGEMVVGVPMTYFGIRVGSK